MGTIVKVCPCCGREYDRAGWEALKFVGVSSDDVATVEQRNCEGSGDRGCGSTIAIETTKPANDASPVGDEPSPPTLPEGDASPRLHATPIQLSTARGAS